MSRLLLLAILVLWMCPRDNALESSWPFSARMGVFLGVYAGVVLLMAAWSRALARRAADDHLGRTLDRYNLAGEIARYFVPAWFAVGIFALGWGRFVHDLLLPTVPSAYLTHHAGGVVTDGVSETYWRIPGLVLGTLPAFAAWMGLWWAQYPADRALKEQNLLYEINEGLPVHAPPAFGTFFVEHLRQQLLFTLAPILLIIGARDLLALAYLIFRSSPLPHEGGDLLILPLAAIIFVFAPELLRRIIPTRPLPRDWPLRRRLEALCLRTGLKYREILLWETNKSMGNAMVMGLFPRVRYIFLSDLLLETMRDEEIEAVFAHEIGHIAHRHMWWYVLFMALVMLFVMGPIGYLLNVIPGLSMSGQEQVSEILAFATFILMFGVLSRRFERQADVYAARTMESWHDGGLTRISHANPEAELSGGIFVPGLAAVALGSTINYPPQPAAAAASRSASASWVGEYGAELVARALGRVARINNIPIAANEWLHGSIAHRMRYLRGISSHAQKTAEFDRSMRRLKWGMVALLMMLGMWVVVQYGLP